MNNKCICGNEKKKNLKSCGNKVCADKLRGMGNKGKKRPHHSELMKRYAEEGRLDAWKKIHNKELNSTDFKIKRLKKHTYQFDETDENDINEKYKKLLSDVQKGIGFKRNSLVNFIVNENFIYTEEFLISGLSNLTEDYINECNKNEIEQLYKERNSLKSVISRKRNPNMGSNKLHKNAYLDNLRFNKNNKTAVYVKSSYEENYVTFFEENKILWDYEPLTIKTDTGFYIPDFVFEISNTTYLMEIKGFIADFEEYKKTKLDYAIEYCKNNKWHFIYTENGNPTSMKEILKEQLWR